MAKLTRKLLKQFASTAGAGEIDVFGSLAASALATSTDPDTIQSLSAWLDGWAAEVMDNDSPVLEDANAVDFVFSYMMKTIFQMGVPEYLATETYYIGSIVNSSGKLYISLTDNNLGNALTSTTNWVPMGSSVKTVYTSSATFVAPAGVTRVSVIARRRSNAMLIGGPNFGNFSAFVDPYGNAYTIGKAVEGALGTTGQAAVSVPSLVVEGKQWRKIANSGLSDGSVSLGIDSTGNLFAWGYNANGQLGDGTVADKSSPVAVAAATNIKWMDIVNSPYGTFALSADGFLYSCGLNANGELGLGDVTPRSSPVLVSSSLKFKKVIVAYNDIATANNTYCLTADGDVYAMGVNAAGQLGDGTIVTKSTPTLVVGGKKFSDIEAAFQFVVGLEAGTGNIYKWGLGAPATAAATSSPVLVSASSFSQIAVGIDTLSMLKSDGTLFMQGANVKGQLGDGTVVSKSTPTAVIGGFSFSKIFNAKVGTSSANDAILASTEDGSLYGWGANANGQLGLGDVVARSSPVAVLGSFKFKDALVSGGLSVHAFTSDGRVTAWGYNADGQLGVGDVVPRSSPVLVSAHNIAAAADIQNPYVFDVNPGSSYVITVGGYYGVFGNKPIGSAQPESIEVYYDR